MQGPQVAEARASLGISQSRFAALLGVSMRTVQDWEQGRRQPGAAASSLIRIAIRHPKVVLDTALSPE
ncbi:MAG: helix-turn-helix domain-containing protein [Rhodocyclaceae bacterium]|nr:helix-turn-helix domain-containing protein [Rhodocyclaceae bacterium]